MKLNHENPPFWHVSRERTSPKLQSAFAQTLQGIFFRSSVLETIALVSHCSWRMKECFIRWSFVFRSCASLHPLIGDFSGDKTSRRHMQLNIWKSRAILHLFPLPLPLLLTTTTFMKEYLRRKGLRDLCIDYWRHQETFGCERSLVCSSLCPHVIPIRNAHYPLPIFFLFCILYLVQHNFCRSFHILSFHFSHLDCTSSMCCL